LIRRSAAVKVFVLESKKKYEVDCEVKAAAAAAIEFLRGKL